MAEMLVRVVDKVNPNDDRLNNQCLKRGDVVTVQEDGWPWSPAELAGDPWVVIKLPDVGVSKALVYLAKEVAEGPEDAERRVLRRRMYSFDLDAAAVSKEQKEITLSGNDKALAILQVQKQPLFDPDVFAK